MWQSCKSQGVSSLLRLGNPPCTFSPLPHEKGHPRSSLTGTTSGTLNSILIISLHSPLPSSITNQAALVTHYFITEYRLQTLFIWGLIMSQLLNQFYRQCLTKLSYSMAWKHMMNNWELSSQVYLFTLEFCLDAGINRTWLTFFFNKIKRCYKVKWM